MSLAELSGFAYKTWIVLSTDNPPFINAFSNCCLCLTSAASEVWLCHTGKSTKPIIVLPIDKMVAKVFNAAARYVELAGKTVASRVTTTYL